MCLDQVCAAAVAFAQDKIARDGGTTTDKNGLTLLQVAAINLYTQEAIYQRLNSLLNARKERSTRLKPWFRYMHVLFEALDKLEPYTATGMDL